MNGWQVPAVYTGVDQELAAAHSGVALADISAFVKTIVFGRSVPAIVREFTEGGPLEKPGGVAWIDARERRGAEQVEANGPCLACRLSDDRLLLLAESQHRSELDERLATVHQKTVQHCDATSAYAGFELIGPHADAVLRRVTAFDLSTLANSARRCAEANVAEIHAILVRVPHRTHATRVYVSWDFGEYLWARLLDAKPESNITPVGLESRQRLGLEAKA